MKIYFNNAIILMLTIAHTSTSAHPSSPSSTNALVEEQNINIILVLIVLGFIAFIAIVLNLYNKLKKSRKEIVRSKEELSVNLQEKTLLLTELNHRVKNNLAMILSLMQLQRKSDKTKQMDWEQLESRINTMAMAHSLYSYSNKDIKGSTINLVTYLTAIKDSYLEVSQRNLKFNLDFSSEDVSVENGLPIGIIFNELVSNSIKHAVLENDQLIIEFSVTLKDDVFTLFYKDNGYQFNETTKESTGIFILHALTRQLKGSIHRKNSTYKITLHKKN